MTTAQTAALKSELQSDPRGYGYATQGDADVVKLLMLIRDGTPGTVPTNPAAAGGIASGIITVRRNDISGAEIIQATDPNADQQTGANAPSALLVNFFNACCSMRSLSFVDAVGADNAVLKNLRQCFTANSPSRTALNALSKRVGSRLEELFLAGFTVNDADVAAARLNG